MDHHPAGDPAEEWRRLFQREGRRVTLLDRYELEARHRGIAVADLTAEDRARLSSEVLAVQWPGFELTGAARGEPVAVVPYDPAWPETFLRWRMALAAVLPAGTRIEHIGSTSVPGLAAKPVIDILVIVPDLDDEASYVPSIEALGVPLRARDEIHRYFRPAPPNPREVQIHVCGAGSGWEREHLLFRDYLRAHPDVAAEYAALKRRLAATYRDDRLAYTDAKTDFILDTLESAERWAVSVPRY